MKLLRFPRLRQVYKWDCGASAIQSVLAYYGVDERAQTIIKVAKTTRSGTTPANMKNVFREYGLKVKAEAMTIDEVKGYINRKIPVILALQAWTNKKDVNWAKDWTDGHYAVAIGYDRRRLYFEDPSSMIRTFLTFEELQPRWHDVEDNGEKYLNYGIAVYGKSPSYHPKRYAHMD